MLIMCLFAIFFVGCASGFKSFYNPWFNENYFPQEAYLKEGEEPVLMKTSDLDAKYREVTSRWYWCIGYSGFNGPNYSENAVYRSIANFSKEVKARSFGQNHTQIRETEFFLLPKLTTILMLMHMGWVIPTQRRLIRHIHTLLIDMTIPHIFLFRFLKNIECSMPLVLL